MPSVSIRQGYGLTETRRAHLHQPHRRRQERLGGTPGAGDRRRDPRRRRPPAPARRGRRGVRALARGHAGILARPRGDGEALEDGWLHTGDIGYLDAEGYLFIVDRKKDLIIRGGFNVYPRDVEDALVKHPAVQMAAVVGRPCERHGEEVVAFVSLAAERGDHRRRPRRVGPGAHRRLQVPARGAPGGRDPAHAGRQDRPQGGPGARRAGAVSPRAGRLSRATAGPRAPGGSAPTRLPLTRVPLVESRSRSTQCPSRKLSRACRRETDGWPTTTSQRRWRPTSSSSRPPAQSSASSVGGSAGRGRSSPRHDAAT